MTPQASNGSRCTAIKMEVDLFVDEGINHASARQLDKRGYKFFYPPTEVVAKCNPLQLEFKGGIPSQVQFVLQEDQVDLFCKGERGAEIVREPANYIMTLFEQVIVASQGRKVSFAPDVLRDMLGKPNYVDFLELYSGRGEATNGVRIAGLTVHEGMELDCQVGHKSSKLYKTLD